ncbi:MAG: MBL fold metallo-hydrolase [Anaerolineae bacterium]
MFDTGADGDALLSNMAALKIDPQAIEAVVLSHNHADHTDGLQALLATGVRPDVYLIPAFSASFRRQVARVTNVIEAASGQVITEGIFTTGEIDGSPSEQAIAIETDHGFVIVTGCAHPGITRIIEHIKATADDPVYLVLGGFHLKDKTHAEIATIVQAFRRLGVAYVGPCHCTGAPAIAVFAEAYGEGFIQIGTGKIIEISVRAESPLGN